MTDNDARAFYGDDPAPAKPTANPNDEVFRRIEEQRNQRWHDELAAKSPAYPNTLQASADEVYGVSAGDQLARDWDIPRDVAASLADLEARKGIPAYGGGTIVTDEQVEAWTKETDRLIRQEFGTETDAILEQMRALVGTRPELAKALESSGSGSHPGTVLAIARAVKKRMDAQRPPAAGGKRSTILGGG